jgi:hypothetical protein
MKCEICHKADATKAIRRGDDEDDELYVCDACAKAERQRRQKKSQRTRKVTGLPPGMSMSVTQISSSGDDGKPPPIIGAIMNAFQDMVSDIEKAEKEAKKPEKPKLSDLDLEGTDAAFIVRGRLHLEGLHLIGELDAAKRALHALGMELAGIDADGVSDAGHAYSVRHAPGDEKKARRVASALLREERNARVRLFEEMPRVFGDSLCRALAILKNCRLLSPGELFDLLSPLRLAAIEKMLDGITLGEIEKMLASIDLSSKEDGETQQERDRQDAERADEMNKRFEDVVLNERAEEKFL